MNPRWQMQYGGRYFLSKILVFYHIFYHIYFNYFFVTFMIKFRFYFTYYVDYGTKLQFQFKKNFVLNTHSDISNRNS